MSERDYSGEQRKYRQRMTILVFYDVLATALSYLFALAARLDFRITSYGVPFYINLLKVLPVLIIIVCTVYYFTHLYHSIWTFAGIVEAYRMVLAYVILLPVNIIFLLLTVGKVPRSTFIIGYFLSFFMCAAIRFGYRLFRYSRFHVAFSDGVEREERIMIIGAGSAAKELISDIRVSNRGQYDIRVIVDDNPIKKGRYLEGIKIAGNRDDIPELVKKYKVNKIILAIPKLSVSERKSILEICKETSCKIQTLPALTQIVNEDVKVTQLRDVDITDLLGRDEISVNLDEIMRYISGKTVMVTGGGGSIGSELCRQVASAGPKQLVIFDIYENNAYDIQQELKRSYPSLDLVTLIGSVRNTSRVNWVLNHYKPDILFHAAAHKHVPLMEDSPNEAIKNNVMGTYKLAKAAMGAGVGKFVLISTDKAVNPTNIMGASKRLCEMVIQMMGRRSSSTVFAAVRFGNVLGSNGSVIPLFRKQIREGGPVTVTDERIIRYFMTIPEAVSLVLQAGCYAKGGEVFVLDMGKPVRILDMAENMIKLSGYKPYEDIQIEITGLRPGEKLYEELLMDEEGLEKTHNELIYIGKPIEMNDQVFEEQLKELDRLSRDETDQMKEIVSKIVTTYKPDIIN